MWSEENVAERERERETTQRVFGVGSVGFCHQGNQGICCGIWEEEGESAVGFSLGFFFCMRYDSY